MTVEEAVTRSGLSRTRIYLLIKSGELSSHTIKVRGSRPKRVIYRDSLEEFLANLPEYTAGRDVTKGAA